MSERKTAVVVLAAGLGTRMKSARPKVMHGLGGQPIIAHVMATVGALKPDRTVVVIGPGMDEVAATVAPAKTAVQADRLGTGDAVKAARDALAGFDGTVLIMFGDAPLIREQTLRDLVDACDTGAAVAVLGFHAADPGAYGRLSCDAGGNPERIIEARDADKNALKPTLCNSGVMAVDGKHLFPLIDRIGNDNAKREYYLTDIVALAHADGLPRILVEDDEVKLVGIDSKADLAEAETLIQTAWRAAALAGGVTLIDPSSVWLSHDTDLAPDTVIHPHVVFGPGVKVDQGAEIKSFCHIEGAHVGAGAIVGPFARLRPGTELGNGAHVGNFVEIKNATVGAGAKAGHLTYLGDAAIGARTNVGAGTITCNYDGVAKHKTVIGDDVFIGSNTILIAPVTVGDGAFIAAASTITENIDPGALAVGRARQVTKPERGRQLKERLRRSAEKD